MLTSLPDRDWRVNAPHLVFALDRARFAVVNRMERRIFDYQTEYACDVHRRGPVQVRECAGSSAGYRCSRQHLFPHPRPSGATRLLIQFAPDGSIASRTTLRLPSGFRPLKITISGREVYLVGFTPVVYRYELP